MTKRPTGRPNLLGARARRITFDLSLQDYNNLTRFAREDGVSVATIIRWAVDEYAGSRIQMQRSEEEKDRLAEELAARALHFALAERDAKKET
jgi:hypothetical protein